MSNTHGGPKRRKGTHAVPPEAVSLAGFMVDPRKSYDIQYSGSNLSLWETKSLTFKSVCLKVLNIIFRKFDDLVVIDTNKNHDSP